MTKQYDESDTEKYYDSFGSVYEMVWNEQIHTGFFDVDKSLGQAVQDMNVLLAKQVGLQGGMKVLNIGSGRGGADIFLAKNIGADLVSLDLSKEQLDEAKRTAERAGIADQVRHVKASMTDIPMEDAVLDVLWIQEAFFHCHDKKKAVQEFARLLKQGGRIILEDTLLLDKESRQYVLNTFGQRVFIDELLTLGEHRKLFQQVGLTLDATIDLTPHLEETYRKIVEYIEQNRDRIAANIPEQYRSRLKNKLDFTGSLQLTKERKIGCMAMVFSKK